MIVFNFMDLIFSNLMILAERINNFDCDLLTFSTVHGFQVHSLPSQIQSHHRRYAHHETVGYR